MKKIIALILVLALVLTLGACGQKAEESNQTSAAAEENSKTKGATEGLPSVRTFGTLSLLNMTEEEYMALVTARGEVGEKLVKSRPPEGEPDTPPNGEPDTPQEGVSQENKVVFYDTLDALLMALNAGEIQNIEIYQSVARYLCATDDNLMLGPSFDADKTSETFAQLMQNNFNGNDFAFMMMESNAALRDEFNTAIADMKVDGTLDRLVKEQIDDLIDGGEIKPVEMPEFDGAETVKVAVTGSLPPMDYVAADGTPAGFNTAVLAEISSRIGKNIEIVVVDSLGRASALASGAVDAVFWTRTNSEAQEAVTRTEAERQTRRAELDAGMTEEEIKIMNELSERIDPSVYGSADLPESTITTEPYFSDVLVPVILAREAPRGK